MIKKSHFNLSETARKEIEQKLRSLLEACQTHQTPMFATVAVADTEEGTEYNNIIFGTSSQCIKLTDDQIRRHILIANGFHAVPEREDMTVDVTEIFGGKEEAGAEL